MRWQVEVSSIGKTDLQKFCVEAESWQRALQAARAQRGEEGPMSGFSIELLEEGYRAVDPVSRVRFVVKRAPDDMPVTAMVAKEGAKGTAPTAPSVAPAAPAAPVPVVIPATASIGTAPITNTGLQPTPSAPASSSAGSLTGAGKKSVPPRPGAIAEGKTNGPSSVKPGGKGLVHDTIVTDASAIAAQAQAPVAPVPAQPAPTASIGAPPATSPPSSTKTKKSERPPPRTDGPAPATPPPGSIVGGAPSSIAPVSVGTPTPGLPTVKLLTSREQNPTEASPLTYREYSFCVPQGTSEDAAVEVLKAQLKIVDTHLVAAKMGKLVNLAVFDVEFTGKPPGPPLATLSWKDWKGEPVIGYPRRGAGQKQVKPPSGAPPAGPASSNAPAPVSAAVVAPGSQLFPAPTSFPGGTIPAGAVPAAPMTVPLVTAAAAPQAPVPVPVPVQNPFSQTAPVTQNPFTQQAPQTQPNPFSQTSPLIAPAMLPHNQPQNQNQPGSMPPPAMQAHQQHPSGPPPPMQSPSQPPPAIGLVAPVATFTPQQPGSMPPPPGSIPPPPAFPPPGQQQQQQPVITHSQPPPPGSIPPPAQAQSQPPPKRQPSYPNAAGADGMVRTPSGRFVRGRTTGDELITALFESMHDLHFLRDALDGGQFCLALATEVLPARAAIIHFFDVEKREWVVACTRGKDTGKLLTLRTPEHDDLLRDAARKRRAIVTPNASAASAQRYQTLGGSRSMIIAPIMQAGRALGAIEIINPLDGMPFTEDEGNAMTYIAEQYAEYLGSRGIVLDRERIHSAAAPRSG